MGTPSPPVTTTNPTTTSDTSTSRAPPSPTVLQPTLQGTLSNRVPSDPATAESEVSPTEPKIVMADSRTSGNVDVSLAQSVVDQSTTDVDASKATSDSASTTIAAGAGSAEPTTSSDTPSATPAEPTEADSRAENLKIDPGAANGTDSHDESSRPGSTSPTKVDRKAPQKSKSFKPVSVNKQFLKEAAPTPSTTSSTLSSSLQSKGLSSLGSKPAAGPSKLKLVRSAGSTGALRTGSGSGTAVGGADTVPVWNKNKAPPPPQEEPRLTDEQLKSRFGIHLASRLDEDANKGAKWADIDEDDDDWVPQKIEWADGGALGAASPVRKADSPPPPPPPQAWKPEPEPVKVAEPVVPPVRQATPILAPSRQTTPVLATKLSGKPKTLVTEKTTTKVTDGAASTAPKASPWAKIVVPTSPVVAAPAPPAQRPQVFERHERHEERPREVYQAAEVSAEGYDRAWRDRRGSANQRELFNSQTGQMEPVSDGPARNARAPRNEAPLPKTAVLQRPSPTTTGPAEPSSAFQQSRVPMRQDDYHRRRTSSNVSGGSGAMGRRQSFTRYGGVDPPTPDEHGFAQNRYASVFEDGPLHPRAPPGSHPSPLVQHREISPSLRHAQPVAVPSVTPVVPLPSPTQSSAQPIPADPIALIAEQERIMRESREQARKRRQEEEAKEEAAKKERLAAKIAALDAQKAESDRIKAEKAKAIEDKRREEEEKKAAAAATEAAAVAAAAEAAEAEAAKIRVAAEVKAEAAAKQQEAEREQLQQQRALDERQASTIAAAEQRGAHQPLNNHHQSLVDTVNHHTLHQPQHHQLPSSGDANNSNMSRQDPRFGAGHHQTDPALRPDFPNHNSQPQLHTQQQPMMQPPRYRAPQHNSPWARSGRDYSVNAPRENNYNGYAPGPAYGPQSRNHNPLPFNAGRNDQAVYNSPGMHGGLPPSNTSHPPPQALHAANPPPLAHNQNYDRRPQPFNDHHDSRGLQGNAAAPMPGHGGGGNLRDPRRQDVLPNGNNNRSFGPIGQRSDNFVSRNVPKRDDRGTPPPPQNAQQALAATKWGNVVEDLSSTKESRQMQAAPRKAPQFGGTLKPTAVGNDIPAWQEAPAPSTVFTKGHEFNDPSIKKKDIDETAIAAKAAAAKWAAENLMPQFAYGKATPSEANTNDAGITETDINETNIVQVQATEASATEANLIEAKQPVQKVSRIFPAKEPRSQSPPPPMSAEHPVYGDASTRVVQLPSGPKSPRGEKRSSGHDIASVQSQILILTGKSREKNSRQKDDGKINTSPRSTYADTTFAASRRPLESSGAAATVQFPASTSHRVTGNRTERNPRRPENVRSIPTSEDFMNTIFEQEFGSSPTVSLPAVWQTTFTTTSRSESRGELFTPRPPRRHYQDREPLLERNENFSERGIPRVAIRLPGQPDIKQLELHNAVPAPPARRNNGRGRGRANNRGSNRNNGSNNNRTPRVPINAAT